MSSDPDFRKFHNTNNLVPQTIFTLMKANIEQPQTLFLVKKGIETFAINELALSGIKARRVGDGTVSVDWRERFPDLCFPFWQLDDIHELSVGLGVARASDAVDEWFRESISDERINAPWHFQWLVCGENGYLHSDTKGERILVGLKKRISRIVKLADSAVPPMDENLSGLFVADGACLDKIFVSRVARFFGQRRMKDDPAAPSRSYLKIEEAFAVFGCEPQTGELVVDLGAAPGGWSWGAAKRGATVWAIDNGPLKGAVAECQWVHHIREDAYRWLPEKPVDWLFCDMIDDPKLVAPNIAKWFAKGLCRKAVVNFKYGRTDPVRLLDEIRSGKALGMLPKRLVCRHLFHDRDEFTAMIELH